MGKEGEEVCFICAHTTKFWSISPCEHRVCSLCSLRLRGLYQNKACPMCKVEHPYVHITSNPTSTFLTVNTLASDEGLGMKFESVQCKSSVLTAIKQTCPQKGCGTVLTSKSDLRRHVNTVHSAFLCDICLTHKKAFSFELPLYENKSALSAHQRDLKTGHPMCKVCKSFFYSEDELAMHCRDRHEPCHICSARKRRLNLNQRTTTNTHGFEQDHYHADYQALEDHFRTEHFVCQDPICLEAKFVVFENELELKAHMAQVHMDKRLQRSQQRHLQRLDVGFLPSSSSSVSNNSTNRRPNNATPVVAVEAPPAVVQDSSRFFFPPAGQLKTGSWSLLEARNDELANEFYKLHLETASIKALCREYQSFKLSARDLMAKLHHSLGTELLQKVVPKLIDLQDVQMKKQDLAQAYKQQMDKIHAFPPLPQTQVTSLPAGSALPRSVVMRGQNAAPIKGRIVYSKVPTRPATDPSKNPLSLLPGFSNLSKGTGGSGKKSTTPASTAPVVKRDESDYPSLTPPKAKPTQVSVAEEEEEDTFVIGGSDDLSNSSNSNNQGATGKKKKWKPVLHIGL